MVATAPRKGLPRIPEPSCGQQGGSFFSAPTLAGTADAKDRQNPRQSSGRETTGAPAPWKPGPWAPWPIPRLTLRVRLPINEGVEAWCEAPAIRAGRERRPGRARAAPRPAPTTEIELPKAGTYRPPFTPLSRATMTGCQHSPWRIGANHAARAAERERARHTATEAHRAPAQRPAMREAPGSGTYPPRDTDSRARAAVAPPGSGCPPRLRAQARWPCRSTATRRAAAVPAPPSSPGATAPPGRAPDPDRWPASEPVRPLRAFHTAPLVPPGAFRQRGNYVEGKSSSLLRCFLCFARCPKFSTEGATELLPLYPPLERSARTAPGPKCRSTAATNRSTGSSDRPGELSSAAARTGARAGVKDMDAAR